MRNRRCPSPTIDNKTKHKNNTSKASYQLQKEENINIFPLTNESNLKNFTNMPHHDISNILSRSETITKEIISYLKSSIKKQL